MGLPEIKISFRQKADTAIRRGSRGMVAVLLDDRTKEQFLTPLYREREADSQDWTQQSLRLLKLVFKGAPQRVVAVRMLQKDGAADLAGTLAAIQPLNLDWLAYPGYTGTDKTVIKEYLARAHESGKKMKAVLPLCEADDAHIVNFATGTITASWEDMEGTVDYTAAEYCCRVAGILAGLPLTQSCTFYGLPEVVSCSLPENADAEVDAGKLIVVFDGEKFKLGRGVTSLATCTEETPQDLKKIKIVEGMDVITHDIYSTFQDNYIGKVVNSYANKQIFAGEVNSYLKALEGSVLDAEAENLVEVDAEANRDWLESRGTDTSEMTQQELKEANTGSWLFLTGSCRFLDAMEDLQLRICM